MPHRGPSAGPGGGLRWTDLAAAPEHGAAVARVERAMPAFLAELTAPARARIAAQDPAGTAVLLADDDEVVAAVRSVRIAWDGTPASAPAGGAREALGRAGEAGGDTLAVLDVVVAAAWRGQGVGTAVLAGLDGWRAQRGAARLLVLLRPHAKADYPLVPFARYASFVTDLGEPFDPWFRTAWRAGLWPVRAAERSFVARAGLADWQRWLGRPVPGSGPYLVPGAVKPAILETERDSGGYREPHLWATPGAVSGAASGAATASEAGVTFRAAPASGSVSGSASGGVGSVQPDTDDGTGWVAALAAAGVEAGDRSHRQVRRRR